MKEKKQIQDDKLKPLIPTLREKKRFILGKIESEKKFEFKEISEKLIEEIIFYLGAIEFSKSGIWLLRDKFDYEKQEFIIKVSVRSKDKLVGILSIINKISNSKVKIKTLKVSGTLKGLTKKD